VDERERCGDCGDRRKERKDRICELWAAAPLEGREGNEIDAHFPQGFKKPSALRNMPDDDRFMKAIIGRDTLKCIYFPNLVL
jgi:hypothetical protein